MDPGLRREDLLRATPNDEPFVALIAWAQQHGGGIETAQAEYDGRPD